MAAESVNPPLLNECCRFCGKYLKINGLFTNSVLIFKLNKFPKPVFERLLEAGLTVNEVQERSVRMCRSCLRFLTRFEQDLSVFRKWCEEEEKINAKYSTEATKTEDSESTGIKRERTSPSDSPRPAKRNWTKLPRSRNSSTKVVTQYSSRLVVQFSAQKEAGIIRHVAARNWRTAANLISVHLELMEELKLLLLNSIHRDLKNRSKQKEGGIGSETERKEKENPSVECEEEPIEEFSFSPDLEYEKELRRSVERKRKERRKTTPQKSGVQIQSETPEEITVTLENTEESCVEGEEEQIPEFIYELDEDFDEAQSDVSLDGHLESEDETDRSSETEDQPD